MNRFLGRAAEGITRKVRGGVVPAGRPDLTASALVLGSHRRVEATFLPEGDEVSFQRCPVTLWGAQPPDALPVGRQTDVGARFPLLVGVFGELRGVDTVVRCKEKLVVDGYIAVAANRLVERVTSLQVHPAAALRLGEQQLVAGRLWRVARVVDKADV